MSKKDKTKELLIIFCPPLCEFPEQPSDQSKCELVNCPLCADKMWISEKKKILVKFSELTKKNIILSCYNCFKEFAEKNKHLLKEGEIKIINM